MRMQKENIIKFIFIIITLFYLEGGKTIALINHQIYCTHYLVDIDDSKISNNNYLFDSLEEDNWNLPYTLNFPIPQLGTKNQITSNSFSPQKSCNSIWQPPKLA